MSRASGRRRDRQPRNPARPAARFAAIGRSHTHRLQVRYNECDPQGHVFNANYFMYFDVAVTGLLTDALGSYGALLEHGVDIVVAEAAARFRGPGGRFEELLDVEVAVERLGETSLVTRFDVRRVPAPGAAEDREDGDDGRASVCEGRLVHVFVDRDTLAKTPIPAAVRAALELTSA